MLGTISETQTYTMTDVRKVTECIIADFKMIAKRTQAMCLDELENYVHDIHLMAQHDCLKEIHFQLKDTLGGKRRVQKYSIKKDMRINSLNPNDNRWPCLPNGRLCVIIIIEPIEFEKLKQAQKLKIPWGNSQSNINYEGMKKGKERFYGSGGYGCYREMFSSI